MDIVEIESAKAIASYTLNKIEICDSVIISRKGIYLTMQSIQTRIELLHSKLNKLIQKMEELERNNEQIENENIKLKAKLSEQEILLNQWKSKVNRVTEATDKEQRQMIKAKIDQYVSQIDECIDMIKAT